MEITRRQKYLLQDAKNHLELGKQYKTAWKRAYHFSEALHCLVLIEREIAIDEQTEKDIQIEVNKR